MALGWFRRLIRRDAGRQAARVPDGMRLYAIGDIHGRLDCLRRMEALIAADLAAHPAARPVIIHLGDYVDRGPDSRGVIEALVRPGLPGIPRRCLRGNHEAMLLQAMESPRSIDDWRQSGGIETLHSYGVDIAAARLGRGFEQASEALARALPAGHRDFLEGLEALLLIGDYAFVHAGLRPGVPLEAQALHDLLWIREEFLEYEGDFGAVVVHGHTPVGQPDERPNRINLDTAAYLTGRLTALVLEGASRRFLST